MLIDNNGREVRAESLPKNRKAREAALATVQEVLVPQKMRGPMFSLGERAFLKQSESQHG